MPPMPSHTNRFYDRLGVRRVINASSWITVYGGSVMPPAVVDAMAEASRWFVDMHELNRKAGDVIARLTGAEAGLVTAGGSSGMLLEAAACIAGSDPARVWQLPDTAGMKNEIVIHRAHRVGYDHSFRAAGAKFVEIGDSVATREWELEAAIGEDTAAVAYIFGPRSGVALPLQTVIDIAHARGVPVIVDAAGMLPPPENLTRFVSMGADMVSFSGGKGVLGPQSTGILAGRADLIEAAYANGQPNAEGIGRAAKVCKEEIAGLVTALELFADTDFDAVQANWRAKAQHVADAVGDVPGVRAEIIEADPQSEDILSTAPRAQISLAADYAGPPEDDVIRMLLDGNPSVRVLTRPLIDMPINVIPVCLADGEEEIVAQRLKEILGGSRA